MSPIGSNQFTVSLAKSPEDLLAAQRLRYDVFVRELGGQGAMVDHDQKIEQDRFDPFFDHLLLRDQDLGQVVGVYRLLRDDQAKIIGQFYSEDEYDLSVLKTSGRRLLELGRSCVHKDYRNGMAMVHLWNGLADYVDLHRIDILFGVASFHGTNVAALAHPLSLLRQKNLAPPDLWVQARKEHYQTMDLVPANDINRRQAVIETPALIKAYLRLGGYVGEGAFVDHSFNTVDVCLVLDTERMNAKRATLFRRNMPK